MSRTGEDWHEHREREHIVELEAEVKKAADVEREKILAYMACRFTRGPSSSYVDVLVQDIKEGRHRR
jgi:hypothetical protein